MTMPSIEKLAPSARAAFAASLAFLGVLHVIFGERLARMLPVWPEGPPGRPIWAHVIGALMAILAGTVLLRREARSAGVGLGVILLIPVLALHVPRALPTGQFGDAWLNVFKWLAMAGGPFVAVSFLPVERAVPWRDRLISSVTAAAPWLMGAFMIGSAILHVRFAEGVAQLMQPWMPWRIFWTYFAAVALAAGGVGLVVPKTARLAAMLTSQNWRVPPPPPPARAPARRHRASLPRRSDTHNLVPTTSPTPAPAPARC
jgi:uncharacterized membrane protein